MKSQSATGCGQTLIPKVVIVKFRPLYTVNVTPKGVKEEKLSDS